MNFPSAEPKARLGAAFRPLSALIAALLTAAVAGCGDQGRPHADGPPSTGHTATAAAVTRGGSYSTADADSDYDDEHPPAHAGFDDGPLLRQYGRPAAPPVAGAVAATVRRYYAAALAENGARACQLLSSALAQGLAAEGGQPTSGGGGCAKVASGQLAEQHGQIAHEEPSSMRVKAVYTDGQLALAVLSLRHLPESEISLALEGGTWRLDALFASYMP